MIGHPPPLRKKQAAGIDRSAMGGHPLEEVRATMSNEVGAAAERLVGIMARLRAENGCPWDREQDLRSLRPYLVEETYEVLDEMDRVAYGGPWAPLCEELGDLLFQIVFHAQLASEQGKFTLADVCQAISDKIVSRHPHVFGQAQVAGAAQVLANWAKLKAEEKKRKTGSEGSVLDGVPSAAPALLRAERLTEKASRIGFDWPDVSGARAKLDEELAELDQAIRGGDRDALEHELGDVLFALANLARFIRTPPEDALRQANRRFTQRFHHIEQRLREAGIPFGEASLEQMDRYWDEAKAVEKSLPPPRHLPRADVCRLVLPTRDLGATGGLFDGLCALWGWTAVPSPAGERRYLTGGIELRFTASSSPVQEGAAAVELSAPSRRAVDAAHAALRAQGIALQAPGESGEGYGASFRDPDGRIWRYGFDGPARSPQEL